MRLKLLCFLLTISPFTLAILSPNEQNIILKRLSQEKYFAYQDIIINRQTIWQGLGPNCQQRYDLIRPILNQYKRPIKVLDLGASNGYFSFKIAQDYPSLCVMMDLSNRLLDICYLNDSLKNIVYLKKEINLQILSQLAKYEHFDLILGLNILHHLDDCKEIIDLLFTLGDIVIIETPGVDDVRRSIKKNIPFIQDYLQEQIKKSGQGVILGHVQRTQPCQFDYIQIMSTDLDLISKINYLDSYSTIFCFGSVNNGIIQDLYYQKEFYAILGGVYYS